MCLRRRSGCCDGGGWARTQGVDHGDRGEYAQRRHDDPRKTVSHATEHTSSPARKTAFSAAIGPPSASGGITGLAEGAGGTTSENLPNTFSAVRIEGRMSAPQFCLGGFSEAHAGCPSQKPCGAEYVAHDPCRAASAAFASPVAAAKNSADCPMNSPSAVNTLSVPIAAPVVSVGRMIETIGNLRSRKV